MLNALAFIFTMGILVLVHEYGHFQVAKWCGVKVLRFSVGFGKPLWRKFFGKDKTEFILAAIPLGGYVKMLDEKALALEGRGEFSSSAHSEQELMRAFNRQSVAKRIAIVLAGPLANLLFAIALYWILFVAGIVGVKPILGEVIDESPAQVSGFISGEEIKKINGKPAESWQEVSWMLLNQSLKNKNLKIETLNSKNEIRERHLDLTKIDLDDTTKNVLTMAGFTMYQPSGLAIVGEVVKGGSADVAGIKKNDLILMVNHQQVALLDDFVDEVKRHPNQPLEVLIERNLKQITLNLTPEKTSQYGQEVGRVGIAFKVPQKELDKIFITSRYAVSDAFLKAVEKTWETSIFTLKMLGEMITGEASFRNVSGPITIASYAGQSAQISFEALGAFLAAISISIGVLNLLPIPVLDGGYLMYYVVEIFTGKAASDLAVNIGQKIGIFLLACMMALAFYNDIHRLIAA